MRETLGTYAGRIAHERKTRMRFLGILIAVALVVAAGVSWQLHYTGVAAANETYCGIEEHQHTDECYETELTCGLEDGEFDPAVAAVHSHSDACYETILTCTLPEHIHTVECLVDPNTEESPEMATYVASNGGVEVTVSVPFEALPEDAELQVILYDRESDEYAKALSLVENTEVPGDTNEITTLESVNDQEAETGESTGSVPFSFGNSDDVVSNTEVLDISFLSDGAQVEPTSPADVTIDASELLADCGGTVESLEVWHLKETEEGTQPVLAASISDPQAAANGVAEFTVESFSEFEFHYTSSAGGWAGFGTNLIDENGSEISATVSDNYTVTEGRYTTTVTMPYTLEMADFANAAFTLAGTYTFRYATVTDPNYGDKEHTFDVWDGEAQVGANELYGSAENPVVSVTISGTEADENPNYDPSNPGQIVSRTWHFTLTYADGGSVTIPIYGNADGADDGGGKYCPKYLELNLYFETGKEVVLNLGNGNGTNSDGDYTGSNGSGGDALRYSAVLPSGYADYLNSDGNLIVNLPSDNDLDAEFTVVNAIGVEGEEGYEPAVTVELGKEQAYDYKLVGWINIATGEYYDVSEGSTTAEVNLDNSNVFYADWIAASYDHGYSSDENLKETVSTESFVTFDLFDYNELFDLYSASLTQNGTDSESWTDSGSLFAEPLLGNDLTPLTKSFVFQNNGTTHANVHVLSHCNPQRWNIWTANSVWDGYDGYDFVVNSREYWDVQDPDSTMLGMLYDKSAEALGVNYVGQGDYLFWIDENGYYTYDSAVSGAAYNQTDQRFYVYEDNANAFFPYNGHTDSISSSNGLTNYWFGMSMDVDFYLPNATASGSEENPVNQIDDRDMIFDFSGDDDIIIFVDDVPVVDMAGIHSTSYSRIDFSTNTVTYSMGLDAEGAPDTSGAGGKYYINNDLNLSAGYHTLTIRYMERGAAASNLKIQFKVASIWEYGNWDVQTVTAEKDWVDSYGNEIDPADLKNVYQDGVEVGLFDALSEATEDTFGYKKDGDTYTVEYTDDDGIYHKYVYDADAPSLTYTEGDVTVTDSKTDSEGRVVDSNGYVIAWLEGDILHIRIDEQTLKNDNNWYYAWELLDADGTYEVLELTGKSSYTTQSKKEDLTEYNYWSIIGEQEIEENLTNPDFKIVLTEAAQESSETIGDTQEAYGWVIVASQDGTISAQQVKFSHFAQLFTDEGEDGATYYYSLLGVTSQSEIAALGDGAIWYLEDSGQSIENMGNAEEFYIYCFLDGEPWYLTIGDDGESLIVTSDSTNASMFYYDFLGELRIVRDTDTEGNADGRDRVVIDPNGKISLAVAEDIADSDDVRFYTLTLTQTTGFSFTAVNTFLPDFTLVKVDSITSEPLAGVSFTLTNEEGLYYAGFDEETDEAIWSNEPSTVTTSDLEGEYGQIIFHYLADGAYTLTETQALDGYSMLPSAITITITDGKVVDAAWTQSDVSQDIGNYVAISEDGLAITVENMSGRELPQTGGMGTTIFTLIGLVIVGSAGALLINRRRRGSTVKEVMP